MKLYTYKENLSTPFELKGGLSVFIYICVFIYFLNFLVDMRYYNIGDVLSHSLLWASTINK